MIYKVTILSLLSILFLGSCVSTNKGYQSSPVIAREVKLDPLKADIKVDESKKITGEATATYLLGFRIAGDKQYADGINYSTDASSSFLDQLNPLTLVKSSRLSTVRGAAAFVALDGTGFDLIVHPTYSVTVKNFLIFKKYTVTVTGYGANYQNFRTERQKIVILNNGKEMVFPDEE